MTRRTRFPSVWVDLWRAVRTVLEPALLVVLVLSFLVLLTGG